MADWIDEATELSEEYLQKALSNIKVYSGVSAENCIECNDIIPSKRRKLIPGVQYCVYCQELKEKGKL